MTAGLRGRVVWVTGAASGIGAATARLVASRGASVVCLDSDEHGLGRVADEIREAGGAAVGRVADVTDLEALRALAVEVEDTVGATDTVVASAGVAQPRCDASELDLATWQHVLAVNVTGVFLTVQVAIPQLRRRGGAAIVVVSSVGGLRGSAGYSAYVASKHGVIGLMRSLANELANDGIRVNAVCPGTVDTPMLDAQAAELGLGRADADPLWAADHLFPRLITPGEVAEAIVWLVSDGSAMVTGAALPVDAGLLARPAS
jgi:NAD(P)-dependent dehydrogenase (short-subunit alcohol dehydrogenase family)